jgi:hypothetical protein
VRREGERVLCYYGDVSLSLGESVADVQSQTNGWVEIDTTIGWRPPVKNLSLWATGSVQGAVYSDFPGGRQDLIFIGSGNFSGLWMPGCHLERGREVHAANLFALRPRLERLQRGPSRIV